MPLRSVQFSVGSYYHVFNRGVEKRTIFLGKKDYQRFLETVHRFYWEDPETQTGPRVGILAWCLMPNHYHFLLTEKMDYGVQNFLRLLGNSYTKYFNTKNQRIGPLFQGPFKAVHVKSDEQLLHVSRYIHLNPLVAKLSDRLDGYQWSSFHDYLKEEKVRSQIVEPGMVLDQFLSTTDYQKFVEDYFDYACSLEAYKKIYLEQDAD